MADPGDDRIDVVHPDGRRGTVPRRKLIVALNKGYKMAEEEEQQGAIQRFLSGLRESTIDPIEHIGGILQGTKAPQGTLAKQFHVPGAPSPTGLEAGLELAEGAVRSQLGQFQQATRLQQEGEPLRAAGHAVAGFTPIVGPLAANIAERASTGDVAGATGEALPVVASLVLPPLARAGKRTVLGEASATREIQVALRPPKPIRVQLEKNAPIALDEIALTMKRTGKNIASREDLLSVTREARQAVGQEINRALAAKGGATVSGDSLVKAVSAKLDKSSARFFESKELAQVKRALKRELSGKTYSLAEAEELRGYINTELNAFFRMGQSSQRAAAGVPQTAGRLALRDALADEIDTVLANPEIRKVRQRYSALRSMEDATQESIIRDLIREDPSLLQLQSLDTIAAGSGFAALLLGHPEVAKGAFATVLARRGINLAELRLRSPDARIARVFNEVRRTGRGGVNTALVLSLLEEQEPPPQEPVISPIPRNVP